MASGIGYSRSSSMTSTQTAIQRPREDPDDEDPAAAIENDNENSIGIGNGIPPRPESICSESRDVSVCSRNSRDSLRRNVSLRSSSFTEAERLFLEQLAVRGSDRDVETALQTVEDEELFFDYTTPRHLKHNSFEEPDIGLDINQSTSSAADDATREAEAASVATSERRGLDIVVGLGAAASSRGIGVTAKANGNANANANGDTAISSTNNSSNSNSNSNSKPPIPTTILGSQKRREVLERRRSNSSLNMATLWRAHENGLAVTSIGSQRSLLRRESSIGNTSTGSNMSGLSVLFGGRPHPGASQQDVFRSDDPESSDGRNSNRSTTPVKGKPPRQYQFRSPAKLPANFPPMSRRSGLHRRSKSDILFSPMKNLPKISERAFEKPTHARAKSFGKRRSVTFHHIDEELEFDKDLETTTITPVDAVDTIPKRSQMARRAVSDSNIAIPAELQEQARKWNEGQQQQQQHRIPMQREISNGSIPSLHHGTPLRQDSISSIPSLLYGGASLRDSVSVMGQSTTSIPSLHHGNPLRDSMSVAGQSTSSIPSLHHGNPLRDSMSVAGQSTSSFPSLHHGNPLLDSMSVAGQSTSSFASLHLGNPLRQESVASFASLHHGNPLRQESMSSIPSIHHGRPIRQDSLASSSIMPPNTMSQTQMVQQFGITDKIAAAWLELDASKSTIVTEDKRRSSVMSALTLPGFPDNDQIPDAATAPTMTTALDAGDIPDTISGLLNSKPNPVAYRQASRNVYEGEGVEVTELDDRPLDGTLSDTDSYYYSSTPDANIFRTISIFPNDGNIRTAGSFDDLSIFSSFGQQQRTSEVFREIRRSLSDDNLSNFVVGKNKEFLLQIPNSTDGTTSDTVIDEISDDGGPNYWETDFASPANGRFDAWNVLQDEYANGYGGAGTLGFKILGTSVSDESAQPHVLSPPLMESLQAFLPPTKSGENFHLKYSMVRDGASLQTLLKRARGIKYSILAVETINGEVFGSFTGQSWRKSWNYFGTGESFLWRMRHSRLEPTNGILDQAQKESEIDVFPYTGDNDFIQLCTHDRIAVGGGIPEEDACLSEKKSQNEPSANPLVDHEHDWGLGLALRSDLLQGSSSPCLTFGSPSLCKSKSNGDRFEVINVELWTMTPCATEEDAEKLELGKLFLGSSTKSGSSNVSDYLASSYTY